MNDNKISADYFDSDIYLVRNTIKDNLNSSKFNIIINKFENKIKIIENKFINDNIKPIVEFRKLYNLISEINRYFTMHTKEAQVYPDEHNTYGFLKELDVHLSNLVKQYNYETNDY